MLTKRTTCNPSAERGVALLISIFALLLISGVAVSLIVMSGTESAIAGNSKANTQAFYAAYAGLEEARGRMWPGHPNTLDAVAGINKGNTVMALNRVLYILNPSAGEVVSPTNLTPNNPYADLEYTQEFWQAVTTAVVQTINSTNIALPVAGPTGTLPGPLYKWVRITAKSEQSAGIDTNGDNVLNNTTPLFYDGANQNLTLTGRQVLRATSLGVMPNGSRRMLQYDIAPIMLNLTFPAALTFDGPSDVLFPANSNVYWVDGHDNAGCGAAPSQSPKPAIGVPDSQTAGQIINDIPRNRLDHYIGANPAPDVETVSMPANLADVGTLNKLLTILKDNANQDIKGPASSLPSYGSPSAPLITYVEGDLTLSGDITGYGILVVTGTYTSSGTVGWRGIVLVVGQGVMVVSGGGNNEYDGAVLLANTRNPNKLGSTTLDWSGGGGNGVYYSSGCIGAAQNSVSYQVLSFREIAE